jgi:hypothetical protein
VVEEEGEDQIGEDISEVLEVKHSVAGGGDEALDLSVLHNDDDCADDHQQNGDEAYGDYDRLEGFGLVDALEGKGCARYEEHPQPELEGVQYGDVSK